MKILLTGANGYIGKRLLPVLLEQGHELVCCVRDRKRFPVDGLYANHQISVVEVDFLKDLNPEYNTRTVNDKKNHQKDGNDSTEKSSDIIPADIDVAYYLIHSMSDNTDDFSKLEETTARNFVRYMLTTTVKQIIYLGGITNDQKLSTHLASRKKVNDVLIESGIPVTSIKAGIIVGSGSSSFEIIRDLVEKLPVMITPKWVSTKTQPIAIRNVLQFLSGVLMREETFGNSYDIGGPDVLTYKEMMLQFGEVRGLKRYIYTVPVMTPRLSSYWLYFVTSTSYKLAVNLVNSMKNEVIAQPNNLASMLKITLIDYKEAVQLAFQRIEQNSVVSSWKDSLISSYTGNTLFEHINVPVNGCFTDMKIMPLNGDPARVIENIWSIGGNKGWYYANNLWKLRGFIDKLSGGVGLIRGRTNPTEINAGDTLDFWRVLVADKMNRRLLLYAEMKLPGEAWLEFNIIDKNNQSYLQQTATFRPKGLSGRLYWYSMLPFHHFIFNGMANKIVG